MGRGRVSQELQLLQVRDCLFSYIGAPLSISPHCRTATASHASIIPPGQCVDMGTRSRGCGDFYGKKPHNWLNWWCLECVHLKVNSIFTTEGLLTHWGHTVCAGVLFRVVAKPTWVFCKICMYAGLPRKPGLITSKECMTTWFFCRCACIYLMYLFLLGAILRIMLFYY